VNIFENFFDAAGPWEMISRAGHILSGITWIGLLYFFNFVQVPAYAQLSDGARSEALRNLTWRALWWFRWAALFTFLFGLSIISVYGDEMEDYFTGQHGVAILTGMLFGVTMLVNVWGIIWRNQKIVIGSARTVAEGGQADPNAAGAAKAAARASRTNTLFSIPMLWFMVFAAHGGFWFGSGTEGTVAYWILTLGLWAFVEASALGWIGGYDSAFNKAAFDNHRNTIIYGFVLLAIIYFVGWEMMLAL
jgi:uncharacterized membrane protein